MSNSKTQKRRAMICDLSLIIGLPFLILSLWIIVQPFRFEIIEELGCYGSAYSYIGYILLFAPSLAMSLGSALLAPLTIRVFLRHRKEMDEFLSSGQDVTHNKYTRLTIIACLDTLVNLPVSVAILAFNIAEGKTDTYNFPYVSWGNVHNGSGGKFPGFTLSSVFQESADVWMASRFGSFAVKWTEWFYVFHGLVFFAAFGTTPEMCQYYRSAFWFLPERLGYERRRLLEEQSTSDISFNSNRTQGQTRPADNRRHSSLTFIENDIRHG